MVAQRRMVHERRFGRRRLICHAWVKVGRRQPFACVVRNISWQGALLEFDGEPPMANRFRLLIEDPYFEAECEVKHRRNNAVGVYFDEAHLADSQVIKR